MSITESLGLPIDPEPEKSGVHEIGRDGTLQTTEYEHPLTGTGAYQ